MAGWVASWLVDWLAGGLLGWLALTIAFRKAWPRIRINLIFLHAARWPADPVNFISASL